MDKKARLEKLKKEMPSLIKKYGNQIITDDNKVSDVEVMSTGSLELDDALGIQGYPKGRIIEIFGPESSGKSTLCLHAIAECQKVGGICGYVDSEHALDPEYAKALGVNLDELVISQPDCAEDALNIMNDLGSQGIFDLLILDSIAAMVPKAELDGEIGDSKMGVIARLMSQGLRKLVPTASNNNCCMIFVNQIRMKIGVMYGSPVTTPGGESMKFASSIRLEVSKSILKDGDDVYGNKTKVKVIKNKMAAPFKIAEFDVLYGQGIDKIGGILNMAIKFDIVKKGGAWLAYNDLKVQGMDKFKTLMIDNPELKDELETKVKQCLKENKEPAQIVETID
jgi:recombination protein RecA